MARRLPVAFTIIGLATGAWCIALGLLALRPGAALAGASPRRGVTVTAASRAG